MADFWGGARRAVIVAYLIVLHAVLIWLLADKYLLSRMFSENWTAGPVAAPVVEPFATPITVPTLLPTLDPAAVPTVAPTVEMPAGKLLIPVAGVKSEELTDTFGQARSEGRVHEAIDIMAPAGTPVLAVADGEIVKFHESKAGGITIYQLSADKKFRFYYAHLQSRAPGIAEKQFVTRGATIGYVGDSGNAGAGNYHLHFSIVAVVDPAKFWDGISINPYPILKGETDLR